VQPKGWWSSRDEGWGSHPSRASARDREGPDCRAIQTFQAIPIQALDGAFRLFDTIGHSLKLPQRDAFGADLALPSQFLKTTVNPQTPQGIAKAHGTAKHFSMLGIARIEVVVRRARTHT